MSFQFALCTPPTPLSKPIKPHGSINQLVRKGTRITIRAEPRRFADFITTPEGSNPPSEDADADAKAQHLIDRANAVLAEAQEALQRIRDRDPADSKHRRSGDIITQSPITREVTRVPIQTKPRASSLTFGTTAPSAAADVAVLPKSSPTAGGNTTTNTTITSRSSGPAGTSGGTGSVPPSAFGYEGGVGSGAGKSSTASPSSSSGAGAGGIDSWFSDKIDTGGLRVQKSGPRGTQQQDSTTGGGVAVLDRRMVPMSMEFAAPEAPAESGSATIFPEEFALRFASESETLIPEETDQEVEMEASTEEQLWEKTTGEEFGPEGYWYRWTQITGKDATGAVAWSERWWEVSDWKGMRELGAEKWGCNASGDAWRETWRESIGFDEANRQPTVERSAHKWAKNAAGNEWEEKWGESYWSAGRAEKFADKWATEGSNVWHERWGENYDGHGGCVKWTDRWAERGTEGGGADKWGEKWEEKFGSGRGTKMGETWSEAAGGERYQRWWGENHFGDGYVQKFGNSNTGEHWDVTEQMDTYYNPIPHFGYDLALAHSPTLRNVPEKPRDKDGLEGGWDALL